MPAGLLLPLAIVLARHRVPAAPATRDNPADRVFEAWLRLLRNAYRHAHAIGFDRLRPEQVRNLKWLLNKTFTACDRAERDLAAMVDAIGGTCDLADPRCLNVIAKLAIIDERADPPEPGDPIIAVPPPAPRADFDHAWRIASGKSAGPPPPKIKSRRSTLRQGAAAKNPKNRGRSFSATPRRYPDLIPPQAPAAGNGNFFAWGRR